MLLTDRNFNTSFFEAALRLSNNYMIIIITFIVILFIILAIHHSVSELTSGALTNESGFLGLGIRPNSTCNIDRGRFESLVLVISLAKAKYCLKTGSTNGLLLTDAKQRRGDKLHLTARLLSRWDSERCMGIRWILQAIPAQIQTYILDKDRGYFYIILNHIVVHRGNSVKTLTTKLIIQGSIYLLSSLTREDWNGGKILDQANAQSNVWDNRLRSSEYSKISGDRLLVINKGVQNTWSPKGKICTLFTGGLNSIRLDKAIKYPTFSQSRNLITDATKHRSIFYESDWTKIKWRLISEAVYKQQVKLVKLACELGVNNKEVRKLQISLAQSLNFRLLAVYKVTTNAGSSTPGIDLILLRDPKNKMKMAEDMKSLIISDNYKASPVKRVMIPKSNGKMRPLGIPTLKDRCLQQLISLIVEPIVEMNSDTHSYGFRKHRGAKNAIGAARVMLQTGRQFKWVLDADIKGFFDNIDHSWLLKHIPLPDRFKNLLNKWLKAGSIHNKEFSDSPSGTPQGGIISPILANFVLNGLEEIVRKSLKHLTGGKEMRKNIYKSGRRVKMLQFYVKTIRYADDFIVICPSRRVIEQYVKPEVEKFLKERGLWLSPEKTKILNIERGDELHFLGYVFKYRENWKLKYSFFKHRIGKQGLALYPSKEKVSKIIATLKQTIFSSLNLSGYELISRLNPIIRGWSMYFNMGESSTFKGYIRYALYKYIWKWAHLKHPRWGKKSIATWYFLASKEIPDTETDNKWTFRALTNSQSRYSDNAGKAKYLLSPHLAATTISGRICNIPKGIVEIHAYSDEVEKLIAYQDKINLTSLGKGQGLKGKLLVRQKGLCAHCNRSLIYRHDGTELAPGMLDINHITPISAKGSKSSMKNMELVHQWCHRIITNAYNSPDKKQ